MAEHLAEYHEPRKRKKWPITEKERLYANLVNNFVNANTLLNACLTLFSDIQTALDFYHCEFTTGHKSFKN